MWTKHKQDWLYLAGSAFCASTATRMYHLTKQGMQSLQPKIENTAGRPPKSRVLHLVQFFAALHQQAAQLLVLFGQVAGLGLC